jgi:hypothetical protein
MLIYANGFSGNPSLPSVIANGLQDETLDPVHLE